MKETLIFKISLKSKQIYRIYLVTFNRTLSKTIDESIYMNAIELSLSLEDVYAQDDEIADIFNFLKNLRLDFVSFQNIYTTSG